MCLPVLSMAFLSSLCLATHSAEVIQLESRFSQDEVAWFNSNGENTLSGSADLRLKNGDRKRCDGFTVELLPAAKYADERIQKTYGNINAGQVLLADKPPKFTPDTQGYHETVRKTKCDNNGQFQFTGLPEGEYYVFAFIIWPATGGGKESQHEGGAVMKRIQLYAKKEMYVLMKNLY